MHQRRILLIAIVFAICFASAKGTLKVHLTLGERDTLTCSICEAKWHIYIVPFAGFQWAELDATAKDGRGQELLNRRIDKKEILANSKCKSRPKQPIACN
jgi:hypothetical protein